MQKLILALLFATFCATILSLPDEVAHCKMIGTSGDVNITGTIVFRAIDVNNTEVTVDISGITKRTNSSHGMHIHAAGDMVSSADGGSADGHFIGGGQAVHGCPGLNASRHSGDMGAWNVSVDGKIQQTKVLDKLPLTGPNSIIGHAAVLHFDNDYCIGATGNAGSRLAWCVVGVANITGAGKTNTAGVDTTTSTVYNATCKLQPTINGVNVSGSFWFKQTGADLHIWGKVSGLVFNSTHGVHIHAFGDLFSNDGLRTAGHYNPTAGTHKLPPSTGRHVGDLGNIQYYDSNGVAWYHETLPGVNIVGDNSIIGRGLIVHAMADNGCTQPTGASAARLAQCVIGFGGSKFTAPPTIPNEVTIVPQIGSLCSPSGTPATADQVECFAKVLNCKVPFDNCKLGETFTKGITCSKCWPDLIKCLNNEAVNLCYDNNQKTTCLADCPTSIATCDGADGIKITASFLLIALLLLVSLMF